MWVPANPAPFNHGGQYWDSAHLGNFTFFWGCYGQHGLAAEFEKAIKAMDVCRRIRNQYAHYQWWDTGKLALADLERIAKQKRRVTDLRDLKPLHVDLALLNRQVKYFNYVSMLLQWINFEGRARAGRAPEKPLQKARE